MNFWERSLEFYGVVLVIIGLSLILVLCQGCATDPRPDVCTVNERLLGAC